jgi:hypothetical protein
MADIEASQCLVVADPEHIPPLTKLVVTCSGDTVEFMILDSQERKVLVKDGKNFTEPTEGKLLGSEVATTKDSTPDVCRIGRIFRPGRLFRMGLLVYEVGGKDYHADGIYGVKIVYPSGKSFDLWSD